MTQQITAIDNLGAFTKNFEVHGVTESVKALLFTDPVLAKKMSNVSDEELIDNLEFLLDEVIDADPSTEELFSIGTFVAVAAAAAAIAALYSWFNRIEQQIKKTIDKIDDNSPLKFDDDSNRILNDCIPFDEWNKLIDLHMPILEKHLDIDTIRDGDFVEWALKKLESHILEHKEAKITKWKGHILRVEPASKIGWTASHAVTGAKTISKIYPMLTKLSDTYGRAKKQVKKDERKAQELEEKESDELTLTKRNSNFIKSYYKYMRKDMGAIIGTYWKVLDAYLKDKKAKEEPESKE